MTLDSNVTSWTVAISTNAFDDRKIFYRYADQFSPTFERGSQPTRIIICWRYHSENGQAIPKEHQLMNQMEEALELALDQNGFVTLALVSTGEDLREWTYYSKSEDEFMAHLNFAFAGAPKYPIEIHIAHDPDWDTYERFRSSLKKEAVN